MPAAAPGRRATVAPPAGAAAAPQPGGRATPFFFFFFFFFFSPLFSLYFSLSLFSISLSTSPSLHWPELDRRRPAVLAGWPAQGSSSSLLLLLLSSLPLMGLG